MTSREEWTNNAASEYGRRSVRSKAAAYDFAQGIKYADAHPKYPWVSVEDDLPYNHEELVKDLDGFEYTKAVLIRFVNIADGGIGYRVTIMSKTPFPQSKWSFEMFGEGQRITHWKPISEPSEE